MNRHHSHRYITAVTGWVTAFVEKMSGKYKPFLSYWITIVIALVVFVLALNAFVELTDDVAENELGAYDDSVFSFVDDHRHPVLTTYFKVITHLGDRTSYIVLTLMLAVLFIAKLRRWSLIAQVTSVLLLSSLSNIVLKRMINRARPMNFEHLVPVNSLSYPSGHAMSAMAFYGFLIYLVAKWEMKRWKKVVLISMLSAIILSVGVSRVYLGVHYPTDVAAGFIGGLIWVSFCIVLFNVIDVMRRSRKGDSHGEKEEALS